MLQRASVGREPFTIQEVFQHKVAAACGATDGQSCEKPNHVGICFAGTNSKLERGKAEQLPSHANPHIWSAKGLACA